MTVETSPDWLPPGWTREFRFQKTGRRITQYVNLASGQRFFTKDDLIRYTKMESKQCANKLPTLRKNMTSTANDQAVVTTAVHENERPEWLPKNWLVEVKTRKSGVTFGKRYKTYVDPSTGLRFKSEPEVLRFLSNAVSSKRNPEQKKRDSRPRKKVVIEKSTDDDLPSGWTKEVMIRRNVYGIRRYAYYTDPVSGYVFCSKRTVLHYLETGEIAKTAFLPKKDNDDQILTNADESQLPAARRKKVKHLADGRELDIGGETSDRSISPDLDTETFEKGQSNNDHAETELATSDRSISPELDTEPASYRKQGKNRKVVSADNVLDSNAAADATEKKSSMDSKSSCKCENEKELDSIHSDPGVAKQAYASTIKSHCGLAEKIIKPVEDRDILGKQPQKLETEKTSDSKSELQPLFSSDQCLEHTMKTLEGGVLHEDAPDDGLVSTPASNVLQEKNLGKTRTESKRSNVETTSSSKYKKMKELDMPRRFSIPFAVLEHEQVANEAKPPCVLADKETRQLNVDPNAMLPHQASPVTLDTVLDNISPHEVFGEQGSDSKLEVQHLFCSDPCLEFAIKTLTGAIPLEDAISEGLDLTSIANVQQQKNLIETRTEHSSCKKTLFNSVGYKRKDVGLQQGSSKQLVGHAPELVENRLSNEQVLDFAAGKIYDSKAIRYVDLTPVNPTVKSSRQLEIGPRTTLEHQNFTYNTTLSRDESSSKSKVPHKNQTVPAQTNDENPRQSSAIPYGSSWSDWSNSFFESPFKILTSSSPAGDSFSFQRNFHQPYFAPVTGQPVQQQQFPSNPPSLSLPKSSTTGAKKSYRKGKKKQSAKEVKS
ncbi:hypothetical protein HRI_004764800 [Hibiscus trionum]|uniref:MBD domain-containing protein n=1 Tax=Hibiscus trionum TaxID=183268 RepID=A0A9W7J921_HIBTR|nr:hypothetical protein HRI_004764800 [Hibiscus trionum]